MKIENGYFYNMEPVIDLDHFVELLLVTLAKRDNNLINKKAKLLPDFKERIEKAMFNEDDFDMDFLLLIDSYRYYERQSDWELELAGSIRRYLRNNNKTANYNFDFDYVEIMFTNEEISKILKKYDDDTKKFMERLVVYLVDYSVCGYGRYHQLSWEECKRNSGREYIRTSPTTFGNCWTQDYDYVDKTANIVVDPRYIKK